MSDWHVTDEIDRLEETYSMMLRYATGGADDPQRDEMHASITGSILDITDRITYRLKLPTNPELYYSTCRYENLQTSDTLSGLADTYRRAVTANSAFNSIIGEHPAAELSQDETERLAIRIFNRIWTSFPLSAEENDIISAALTDEALPGHFRAMLIGALTLGLTHYYDERKLTLLLDSYQKATSARLSLRALAGVLMAIYINRDHIVTSRISTRLEALREVTSWRSDVRAVFMQFIRSRDTERINRTLHDELLPEMLKLRSDISGRLKDMGDMSDITNIEENPEWQELMEQSGIGEKLRKLSRLQEEGGDVFMATFANLKSFPFFNDPAVWFMPYRADHPAVTKATGGIGDNSIAGLVGSAPLLCDSDKYSFIMALSTVPEAQRKMMLSQFDSQMMAQMEMESAIHADTARDSIINKYVMDIYRFFKLFRRRAEFNDPFMRPLNLLALPMLDEDLKDNDTLAVVGEFYFTRGYYEDAYQVLRELSERVAPEASLFQKLGYCRQQCGDTEGALRHYFEAELLNADSLWTQRRIAACLKLLGRHSEALEHYRKVEAARPDDIATALNIGHCYLEAGNYKEALHHYYKVEFIDEKSHRAWRPIAWCTFMMHDFDQSESYYQRILSDTPTSTDYLNIGHLYLAKGAVKEAVNYYNLSAESTDDDIEHWIDRFYADSKVLTDAGVNASILPLIIDAMLYMRD